MLSWKQTVPFTSENLEALKKMAQPSTCFLSSTVIVFARDFGENTPSNEENEKELDAAVPSGLSLYRPSWKNLWVPSEMTQQQSNVQCTVNKSPTATNNHTVISILLQFRQKEMVELVSFHLLKANDIRGVLPNFIKNSLFPVFPRERPWRTVAVDLQKRRKTTGYKEGG